MSKKPMSNEQKAFRFYHSVPGHFVLGAIIWFIGFNLLLLAIDSGSLLQWICVIISLFWGLYHVVWAFLLIFKKLWPKAKKTA